MRLKIAAANWKMNLSLEEANQLMTNLMSNAFSLSQHHRVIISVPFPYIIPVQEHVKGKEGFYVAAQNCANVNNGAYTGEVSTTMLKGLGVQYVIIGHSERRMYQQESNKLLAEKVDKALEQNITPIFCCGEALEVREAGTQNSFVEQQIKDSLFHLSADQLKNVVIAYEPIWAIGTGKTASTAQAQEMHAHIRSVIAQAYGADIADAISILYGGSVKGANAKELFAQPDVDGGLVGGASLNADEFATIIRSLP